MESHLSEPLVLNGEEHGKLLTISSNGEKGNLQDYEVVNLKAAEFSPSMDYMRAIGFDPGGPDQWVKYMARGIRQFEIEELVSLWGMKFDPVGNCFLLLGDINLSRELNIMIACMKMFIFDPGGQLLQKFIELVRGFMQGDLWIMKIEVLTHLWKVEKALGREGNYAPAVSKDEVQKSERCLVLPSVTELQRETPITLVRSGIYTPPLVNFDHWMLELGCMGEFAFDPGGVAAAPAPYAAYLLPRGLMVISIDKLEFYLGDCVASTDNTATLSYEHGLNIHREETESLADVNESVEMVFDPGGVNVVCAHCATLVLSGICADFCCHFGTGSELGQAKAKLMFEKLFLGSKPVMIDYYVEWFACSTSRTMRVAQDKAESVMFDPGGKCSAPIDIFSNNIKATFNPLLVKSIKSNEHWVVLLGINSEPLMIFLIGICSILYAENGTLGICSAGTCLLKPEELTGVNKIGEMVTFDPGKIEEFMFGDINLSRCEKFSKFLPDQLGKGSSTSCHMLPLRAFLLILEDKDPLKKGVLMQDYEISSGFMLLYVLLIEPGLFISFIRSGLSRFRTLTCT